MTNPTFAQESYQFVKDDGTEAGSTLIGSPNSAQSFKVGRTNRFRTRLEITNDSTKDASTEQFNHQYSLNSGTWTAITTSSNVVRAITSAYSAPPADGDDCTQRLGAGIFITDNNAWDNTGSFTVPTFAKTEDINSELCAYIVPADVNHGDTIEIRVVSNSGFTITYTNTPSLTVIKRRIMVTHH